MDTYDVAIVRAGPGGLACAIKAKEMGLLSVRLMPSLTRTAI